VDEVASGRMTSAFITHRFGFVTGREAIVTPIERSIRVRRTYGIGVVIDHDRRTPRGFSVRTAYPRNDDQSEDSMDFPEVFRDLGVNLLLMLVDGRVEADERLLQEMLKGIDAPGRRQLLAFLNATLDGRYDDTQLDALWVKTNTDTMFFDRGGTRRFLTAIRDELAKRPPAE
jgi:hypothetical protein